MSRKEKIKKIISKVTEPTGSVMAGAKEYFNSRAGRAADRTANLIKRARNYDNAPNSDSSGQPTDAFKTRQYAGWEKDRAMETVKKKKRFTYENWWEQ